MSNEGKASGSRPSGQAGVQRQIVLPVSKAIEIAYKNIRMRLSRSLLVTSGIILALAFLMSIQASEAMTGGMREWAEWAPGSAYFAELGRERSELDERVSGLSEELAAAARPGGIPEGTQAIDARALFGKDFPELREELGQLPGSPERLTVALTLNPDLIGKMDQWIEGTRRLHWVRQELTGPQRLQSRMQSLGEPATAEEIADARLQTRWLLGLALLVAFVGILNAMLMSVTERFREIGTMKCLGALDSFIIKLFLIESLFQGTVGTILGVTLGLVLSIVATWATYGEFVWRNFPSGEIAISVVVCLLIGVALTVAGAVYPAWQAARMQPIDAMRVEA